jgi:hypothetical protein
MLWIEAGFVVLFLLLGLTFPSLGNPYFEKLERCMATLARRRTLSLLLVGLLALGLRAAFLPMLPVPEPVVQDEFGYLFSADTFAHGRLTNPSHPMWVHFETFHVFFHPTYSSIYPVAEGLILAAGTVVGGKPFWGVWFSVGVMCAAICWMLQGWLPAPWALVGGLIAVLRFGVFGFWANSYWGGAPGAFGGALVLGALPRIRSRSRVSDAVLLGLGFAILANSRPYEGLILSLPICFALLSYLLGRDRPPLRESFSRLILPLAAVLVITAMCMGYYFWRVTGSPFRMPYQVEREAYAVAPYFLWQTPRPIPAYHHEVLGKMFVDAEFKRGYLGAFSPFTFIAKVFWGWTFYLGPVLSFPVFLLGITLPIGLRWKDISPPVRFLILTFIFSFAGLAVEVFFHPQYPAPMVSLFLVLVLFAARYLYQWQWRGKPTGRFLARSIPVVCSLMFVLRALATPLHLPVHQFYAAAWYQYPVPTFGREDVIKQLQKKTGRHLVLVRYDPDHNQFFEWVYNDADIDDSSIVWARDMDSTKNQELLDYFKDRQIWLLEADANPPRLTPYVSAQASLRSTSGPQ